MWCFQPSMAVPNHVPRASTSARAPSAAAAEKRLPVAPQDFPRGRGSEPPPLGGAATRESEGECERLDVSHSAATLTRREWGRCAVPPTVLRLRLVLRPAEAKKNSTPFGVG